MEKELKSALSNDSLIVFAGSGLSKSIGYPNWNELVIKIIEDLSKENEKLNNFIPLLKNNLITL